MSLIFVINGELQASKYANVQEFCMQSPRGAYTTAHIRDDFVVLEWKFHIKRLIKSIAAVHASLDANFNSYYAAFQTVLRSEDEVIQSAVLPSLMLALSTAASTLPQGIPRMTTIIVSPSNNSHGLDVHVVVAQHTDQPGTNSSGFASILGPPRQVPIGKNSGWVTDRQYLESMRPKGAAEILLSTQDGRILEGLVTNFFVITTLPNGKPLLQTAGMQDGVVWGTMRQRVLKVCTELNIQVLGEAPDAATRNSWQEAFLTNALRRVQPLGRIECSQENVWGLSPWEISLNNVPGPWTMKIREYLESSIEGTDLRTLSNS